MDNYLLILLNFSCIIKKSTKSVLDIECGQGSDSLFITREGHTVLDVDAAQIAIKQMLKLAVLEKLNVNGILLVL